jgi:hypothetical protein
MTCRTKRSEDREGNLSKRSALEEIKRKCRIRGKDWQERAGVKLDLFEFQPNVSGLIGALNQGLKDGADYGE